MPKVLRKISLLLTLIIILPGGFGLYAQIPGAIRQGISAYQKGEYEEALREFRSVITGSESEQYQGDAYFWVGKTYIAMEAYDDAAGNIEYFLSAYPGSILYAEGLYQKGRLHFLQHDFEPAIQVLYSYINKYPEDVYISNAFFWIGESLYSLGRFDEAEKVFQHIVNKFPASFKVEGARFRLQLIQFKFREEELVKLLKISHEEYLDTVEEFIQREKAYEQALSEYQKRLAVVLSEDLQAELDQLNAQVKERNVQIVQLEEENRLLRRQLEETGTAVEASESQSSRISPTDTSSVMKLLNLKAEALELKEFYLGLIEKNRRRTIMFKRIAAPVLLIFFSIALNAADIDNGRIKISFEEKYRAVTFSYLKELGGKNYLPLIFAEDPRTTQFNLLVNNQIFNVAENFDFEPSFENLGKSGRYTWRSKQLEIVQEVSFLSSANAPLADGVMVKFTIKNISSQRLAVGLRYLIDTYLGEGKESHFLNDYALPINHEIGFTSTSAPKYILSPYNNSPDKGLMIMLRSPGVTLPDSVVCANWKRLSDSAWDYSVNTSRNFSRPPYSINDSAVLLNYEPKPLTPGAERSIVLALGYFAPGGFSPSICGRKRENR